MSKRKPAQLRNDLLELPVQIYRVASVSFSNAQVQKMLQRTNLKLSKAGIRIVMPDKIKQIPRPDLAVINEYNIENILRYGSLSSLRIFLVQKDAQYGNESWTYDPVYDKTAPSFWRGAIFITEIWADNSNRSYAQGGFQPTADTLLHELGHVLMQQADHLKDRRNNNFMHNWAEHLDDTITPAQVLRMRSSYYLKKGLQRSRSVAFSVAN